MTTVSPNRYFTKATATQNIFSECKNLHHVGAVTYLTISVIWGKLSANEAFLMQLSDFVFRIYCRLLQQSLASTVQPSQTLFFVILFVNIAVFR